MFWIVEKRDDAIMGFISGVTESNTMAGPFNTFEEALSVKNSEYHSGGVYYYTIVESTERPSANRSAYEFTEAQWEFDDV